MEAMILAAGRGERLRPLTDKIPKPLVTVGPRCLIEHHLINLANSGFKHVVINISYLSDLIEAKLGNGSQFGLEISYSKEPKTALGTGGGIINALPLFSTKNLVIINGDIYTDFAFSRLQLQSNQSAHLIMVKNPTHNLNGDFELHNGLLKTKLSNNQSSVTFSGIGIYNKSLFDGYKSEALPLTDILYEPIKQSRVSAELHESTWIDVGTIDRLAIANQLAHQRQ